MLAGAAHLNHQLRGADADADEEFCRHLAASLDIPLHVERVDVAALAAAAGVSIEQAAHDARHEFFARAAARSGASAVAVGAHARTIRRRPFSCGCFAAPVRAAWAACTRGPESSCGRSSTPLASDVRAFLEARRIAFREDATNTDGRFRAIAFVMS